MKNTKHIILLIALAVTFNACGGDSDSDSDSGSGRATTSYTSSNPWNQSNISGTPTSNQIGDAVGNATGNNPGAIGNGTLPARAGAIPFPALPTNIALDPKYIPPQ